MRFENKGLIDRASPVSFTFDGKTYTGFKGDTLASALLANDVRLMGRSFKYHRPRGPFTADSAEPNALVTIGSGDQQDPNIRATVQEIYEGMEARSQNAWPSLAFDAMAINDRLNMFLSAGFYYKTFMWPKSFWEKLYEPLIRKAAGLGALSGLPSRDDSESAYAHCEVLVIGAGPAGLMAARTATEAGARVILADEQSLPGGRLLAETTPVDGQEGHAWAAQMLKELTEMGVRYMPRTTVTGAYDGGTFGALERVGQHQARPSADLPKTCFWRIVAKRTVLAAGALERPIAFPQNDRPGIMLASAVEAYLNRWGVVPGNRVALFTNNDGTHDLACDLAALGVDTTVIDTRPDAQAKGDYKLLAGAELIGSGGRLGVKSFTYRQGNQTATRLCDVIGVSGGWNPNVSLTCHMNGRPVWDPELSAFVPKPGAVPGMEAAGAACGLGTTADAVASGIKVAKAALKELGYKMPRMKTPKADDTPSSMEPIWAVDVPGRAWLDFQNDVTTKDIKQAARENYASVEHMKRYTTQGMATDQGKNSNVIALAMLADATGRTIAETGTTTYRPPYVPVAIEAMGAGAKGKGFAPERFTTSHKATAKHDAPFIEAGMWYRPSYFPQEGETTWRESCDREVGYVRNAVGIADVSTLGKIDIQGPDAPKLLDFVYTNTFSTLKEGRVRYGLMLREDGHIMDDGTSARFGPEHYVMTTTTAAAGDVMRHLEFVTQCLRPEWDVQIVSVTEAWAQFAVAGPKARDLLAEIIEEPIDGEALPFMGHMPVTVGGVQGRLFRISFSGELAYELAVPSRYGASLFDALIARAEALGGGAYGMEALNVLRIEKGFVTHAEIDGRITAGDLGMAKMVSAKKDCIGKDTAQRPGMLEDRYEYVGVKPVDPSQKIDAGAHLFTLGQAETNPNRQGYLTSVGYSPGIESYLALGFLKNGRARHGEKVQLVDHMRDTRCEVEICDPVFFDPEGKNVRA